jgi:hypothetical protein
MNSRIILTLVFLPLLGGCDVMRERLGIPIPEKVEAEGKAIGSACRHAGRGLEDCFRLNPQADKAAVHGGWKEMNEYMIKNNMQALAPEFPASPPPLPGAKHGAPANKEGEAADHEAKAESEAESGAGHDPGTRKDVDEAGKAGHGAKPTETKGHAKDKTDQAAAGKNAH